jgi:competence protein ComEA
MITTRTFPIARRVATLVALAALIVSVATTWFAATPASAAPVRGTPATAAAPSVADDDPAMRTIKKPPRGKLNLNTASEDQLQLLPGVGPAKAERIVAWRKKNGGYRRVADLRKVKGFGYRTLKKLEPWLDVKGETTLTAP